MTDSESNEFAEARSQPRIRIRSKRCRWIGSGYWAPSFQPNRICFTVHSVSCTTGKQSYQRSPRTRFQRATSLHVCPTPVPGTLPWPTHMCMLAAKCIHTHEITHTDNHTCLSPPRSKDTSTDRNRRIVHSFRNVDPDGMSPRLIVRQAWVCRGGIQSICFWGVSFVNAEELRPNGIIVPVHRLAPASTCQKCRESWTHA